MEEKITSECHAERCPVCNGHTTVNYGKLPCKACGAKGYIIVPNSIELEEAEEKNAASRKK